MSVRRATGILASSRVAAGAFAPTDISWHSLFWASGTEMAGQGYTNGSNVGTWPNEVVAERDATEATNRPTFTSSNSSYNNKPTVNWGASTSTILKTTTWVSAPVYPISVVTIGNFGAADGAMHEGLDSGNRNMFYRSATEYWLVAGGVLTVPGGDTSPHLFVVRFDGSTGNDSLAVDGAAPLINADAGSSQTTGLTLGNYAVAPAYGIRGHIALMGIYSGTITSDPKWADFKSWVTSFYGITVA